MIVYLLIENNHMVVLDSLLNLTRMGHTFTLNNCSTICLINVKENIAEEIRHHNGQTYCHRSRSEILRLIKQFKK